MEDQPYFEQVTFSEQDFTSHDFSGHVYRNCTFQQCNLTNVILKQTRFQEVFFKGCKILGLLFSECNPFLLGMKFEDCHISTSVFSDQKLTGTSFLRCRIHECDFINTDLTEAIFEGSDLEKSVFENTNLSMASFVGADNYFFDPNKNTLKKTKLSLPGALSLLYVFDVIIEL